MRHIPMAGKADVRGRRSLPDRTAAQAEGKAPAAAARSTQTVFSGGVQTTLSVSLAAAVRRGQDFFSFSFWSKGLFLILFLEVFSDERRNV